MNLKYLSPLALLLFLSFRCFDWGPPSINAVCRIRFKDGSEIEGLICIVNGGMDGFRKNGFGSCYTGKQDFNYSLFNVDNFHFSANSSYQTNNKGENIYPQLYFMAAQPGGGSKYEDTFDDKMQNLTVSVAEKYQYMTLKTFYIYQELNIELYLPHENGKPSTKQGATPIKVDEIQSFSLLAAPSDKWLNLIEAARNEQRKVSEDWQDYTPPLWYHEVRKDEYRFPEISKFLRGQHEVIVNHGY